MKERPSIRRASRLSVKKGRRRSVKQEDNLRFFESRKDKQSREVVQESEAQSRGEEVKSLTEMQIV